MEPIKVAQTEPVGGRAAAASAAASAAATALDPAAEVKVFESMPAPSSPSASHADLRGPSTCIVISFEESTPTGDDEAAAVSPAVGGGRRDPSDTRLAAEHLGVTLVNRARFSPPVAVQTFEAALADQLVAACRDRVATSAKARADENAASRNPSTVVLSGASLCTVESRFCDIVFRYPSVHSATALPGGQPAKQPHGQQSSPSGRSSPTGGDGGQGGCGNWLARGWSGLKRETRGEFHLQPDLSRRFSAGTGRGRVLAHCALVSILVVLVLVTFGALTLTCRVAVSDPEDACRTFSWLYAGARIESGDFLHRGVALAWAQLPSTDGAVGVFLTLAFFAAWLINALAVSGVAVGAFTVVPLWLATTRNEAVFALLLALDHVLLALGVRFVWCVTLLALLVAYVREPLREWEHRQVTVRPDLTRRQLEQAIADTIRNNQPRRVPVDWMEREARRLWQLEAATGGDGDSGGQRSSPTGGGGVDRIAIVCGHKAARQFADAFCQLASAPRVERLYHIRISRAATPTATAPAATTVASVSAAAPLGAATFLAGSPSLPPPPPPPPLETTVAAIVPGGKNRDDDDDAAAVDGGDDRQFGVARRAASLAGAAASRRAASLAAVRQRNYVAVDDAERLLARVMGVASGGGGGGGARDSVPALPVLVELDFSYDGDMLGFLVEAADRLRVSLSLDSVPVA